MQSLIAKALRTDLNMSVQISMKAVSHEFNCWRLLTYKARLRELQYESFHFIHLKIYGLNLRLCVGWVELYQVSKHPNVSRNHEQ